MSRESAFSGCMAGLAVGDALGYPVEGWTEEAIRAEFGRIRDYVEAPPDPQERWRMPGLHSDDTQQTLILADVLVETGRADPDRICEKFLELAEGPDHLALGAHRGAGRNFRYTVQSLRDGAGWNGGSRHSAGVGASMRAAPVGLALGIDDAAVRSNTALHALTTHNDPRAVAAAFLVAHTVGRLAWIRPSSIDPEPFLRDEIHFVRRSEGWLLEAHARHLARESRPILNQMSTALSGLTGALDLPPDRVLPGIAERASELAGYTIEHPCRGFAPAGVVSAFYFFLHYRGEFETALEDAVNRGGDADTVGAILGAFCGAFGGIEAIPRRWLDSLRGRDLVLSRARALAGGAPASEAIADLAEAELAWTLEEDRLRREKLGQQPVDSSGWVRRAVVRQRTDWEEEAATAAAFSDRPQRPWRSDAREGADRDGRSGSRSRRPRSRRRTGPGEGGD